MEKQSRIESIAQAIADRMRPSPAPTDRQLWDSLDVARYLRRSRRQVVERIVCQPDFPAAIRIGSNSHPLWEAREVIDWALSHKEISNENLQRAAALYYRMADAMLAARGEV